MKAHLGACAVAGTMLVAVPLSSAILTLFVGRLFFGFRAPPQGSHRENA